MYRPNYPRQDSEVLSQQDERLKRDQFFNNPNIPGNFGMHSPQMNLGAASMTPSTPGFPSSVPLLYNEANPPISRPPQFLPYDPNSGYGGPLSPQNADSFIRITKPKGKFDWLTLLISFFTWGLIAVTSWSFVFMVKRKTNIRIGDTPAIDSQQGFEAFFYVFLIHIVGMTFNEAFIDRCWRRVVYKALQGSRLSSQNLRAASFSFAATVQRILQRKACKREIGVLISYMFLRWGTTAALATMQRAVHFEPVPLDIHPSKVFIPTYQHNWIWLPAVIHVLCVCAALMFSKLSPLALYTRTYDKELLYYGYQRYLDVIPYGSVATVDEVAAWIDHNLADNMGGGHMSPSSPKKPSHSHVKEINTKSSPSLYSPLSPMPVYDFSSLAHAHSPGVQVWAKFRGTMSGWAVLIVATCAQYLFLRKFSSNNNILRYIFQFTYQAVGIGYTFIQNHVVWSLSVEGLVKSDSKNYPDVQGTNYLGATSGIVHFIRLFKQRRPYRVLFLYWLFWIQSLCIRLSINGLLAIAIVGKMWPNGSAVVGHFKLSNYNNPGYFWAGWMIVWGTVGIPALLWLFTPFRSPVGPQDGWRWAKIVQGAILERDDHGSSQKEIQGRYGVSSEGMARFGKHVRPFKKETLW